MESTIPKHEVCNPGSEEWQALSFASDTWTELCNVSASSAYGENLTESSCCVRHAEKKKKKMIRQGETFCTNNVDLSHSDIDGMEQRARIGKVTEMAQLP